MAAQSSLPPLVVHVIYALGAGGLENGLINIINRADPARYRHAIVCLTESGSFAKRIEVSGVQIYELHKRPGNDLGMFWQLYQLLRKLRPAIVHTRNLAALETQVLGLLFPGVKRIHGEHGRDVSDLYGRNVRYQRLRRLLSPLIQRFICVSEDLALWLRNEVQIPEKKIVQIYNGVDHIHFAHVRADSRILPSGFLADEHSFIVGTIGRLAEVKDQVRLLCAVEHILQRRPELSSVLRVIIVGNGPLMEDLKIRAEALGERVWFAGERQDVPELLALMDVFVLPSLGEGISNTVLEAMCMGKPVVATDIGGNPELIQEGETGFLFPVGDSETLAESLMTLFENKEMRLRMGKSGKARVRKRHNWGHTVAAYLAVYDELLDHKPAAGESQVES